jgi:hypothetical protein
MQAGTHFHGFEPPILASVPGLIIKIRTALKKIILRNWTWNWIFDPFILL